MKLIWLSDPHFQGMLNSVANFCIRLPDSRTGFINQNHADSSFCVISGDMVNRGTVADYASLAERLDELQVPVLPMVGNHDHRELFRSALSVPENCMATFVQYSVQTPEGLIICLDTQKTGSDAGEFCAARRDWLQNALSEAADSPVYIFMHHPPMQLGLPMQDTENLLDGEAFLDLVARHANVNYLFIGHVHRPITGTVRGIPFATMRSVLYQAPAPVPAWDWDSFAPGQEAPNLGVLTLDALGVNLQYVQFCDYSEGT